MARTKPVPAAKPPASSRIVGAMGVGVRAGTDRQDHPMPVPIAVHKAGAATIAVRRCKLIKLGEKCGVVHGPERQPVMTRDIFAVTAKEVRSAQSAQPTSPTSTASAPIRLMQLGALVKPVHDLKVTDPLTQAQVLGLLNGEQVDAQLQQWASGMTGTGTGSGTATLPDIIHTAMQHLPTTKTAAMAYLRTHAGSSASMAISAILAMCGWSGVQHDVTDHSNVNIKVLPGVITNTNVASSLKTMWRDMEALALVLCALVVKGGDGGDTGGGDAGAGGGGSGGGGSGTEAATSPSPGPSPLQQVVDNMGDYVRRLRACDNQFADDMTANNMAANAHINAVKVHAPVTCCPCTPTIIRRQGVPIDIFTLLMTVGIYPTEPTVGHAFLAALTDMERLNLRTFATKFICPMDGGPAHIPARIHWTEDPVCTLSRVLQGLTRSTEPLIHPKLLFPHVPINKHGLATPATMSHTAKVWTQLLDGYDATITTPVPAGPANTSA